MSAVAFSNVPPFAGILSAGALALFAMYALSIVAGLVAAFVLRRTVLRGPVPTLVLELPPFRLPQARNVALGAWSKVRTFLADAGTIILALTIVLWALLSYPRNSSEAEVFQSQREQAHASLEGEVLDQALGRIDQDHAKSILENSVAGRLGRITEPLLEPLGMDWRLGVAIFASFAAREVFVSTLAVVFGIEDGSETSQPLRKALASATRSDGSPLMTPLTGLSILVFFVLACQCMSTLAVVKRESESWTWPAFLLAYMSVLAYVASLAVYQLGRLFTQ